MKALFDLLKKAVFSNSKFLEEDIILIQYKPSEKFFN
jgi:hypothetical protein